VMRRARELEGVAQQRVRANELRCPLGSRFHLLRRRYPVTTSRTRWATERSHPGS
jgi:hypothetical protein